MEHEDKNCANNSRCTWNCAKTLEFKLDELEIWGRIEITDNNVVGIGEHIEKVAGDLRGLSPLYQ